MWEWLWLGLLICGLGACEARGKPLQPGEPRASHDEAQITDRMIEAIEQTSLSRYPEGEIKRFNQGKGLGCFAATFAVAPDLPAELHQGLFQGGKVYPARIRFSNASEWDDSAKDFRGMSIKLTNVAGQSLWGRDGVQDFLLNSHPALFAGTPKDFLAFVEAARDAAVWRYFVDPRHFYSLWVVLQGRDRIASPFDIRYWSTTPYRFGASDSVAVKYSTRPCSRITGTMPARPGRDYLAAAMKSHLQQAEACFDFMVQFQTDPKTMPIEDAAVEWDERASPFRKLATITIGDQDFQATPAQQQCERMSFNPWQSLAAHEPIGGINRVRRPIYSELARFRAGENRRRGIAP
jgi:hypothetical protein